jgi:hypothetical protein
MIRFHGGLEHLNVSLLGQPNTRNLPAPCKHQIPEGIDWGEAAFHKEHVTPVPWQETLKANESNCGIDSDEQYGTIWTQSWSAGR